MRKTDIFKLDSREITVKELRVKDILSVFGGMEDQDVSVQSLLVRLNEFLPKVIDGLTVDEMQELAPSEIKLIFDKIKEVNSVFFETAQALGLGDFLKKLKNSMLEDFSAMLPGLSKPDTVTP